MRTAPAWRGRSSPHVHNPTSDREGISTCAKRTLVVEWCSRMQKHPMVAEVCSYMYITPLGEVGHLCMCTAPPQPRRVFAHAQCPPRGGRLSRMCIAPPNGEIVRACAQHPLVSDLCSRRRTAPSRGGRLSCMYIAPPDGEIVFAHAHSSPSWQKDVPYAVEGRSRMRTVPPRGQIVFAHAHSAPSWWKVRACAQRCWAR